jgi:hypothetical protein
MSEADEVILSDVIRALAVGWRNFSDAAAREDLVEAEAWAEFTFGLYESVAPVDAPPRGEEWTARLLFLLLEGDV